MKTLLSALFLFTLTPLVYSASPSAAKPIPATVEKKAGFIKVSYYDANLQTDYEHLFRAEDVVAIEAYRWTKTSHGRYSIKIQFKQLEYKGGKSEPRSISMVVATSMDKDAVLNGIIRLMEE